MNNILSNLTKLVKKKKKRLGRGLGSNRGSKSGRGTTRHQKARGKIPLHFEGGQGRMVKRFPLLRGKGKNKAKRLRPIVIGLEQLNCFANNSIVDLKGIVEKKLIDKNEIKFGVKILKKGVLNKKLTVKVSVSETVRKEIESVGGKVEI